MANNNLLQLLLLLTVAVTFVARSNSSTTPSEYEMLAEYNFPHVILPEGVKNYTLHQDGSFDVNLPSGCKIDLAGHILQYERKIRGNIQSMLINKLQLQGVNLNLAVNRVEIKAVERDGNELKFDAGVISKSFAVGNFIASPRCNRGPGFPK